MTVGSERQPLTLGPGTSFNLGLPFSLSAAMSLLSACPCLGPWVLGACLSFLLAHAFSLLPHLSPPHFDVSQTLSLPNYVIHNVPGDKRKC